MTIDRRPIFTVGMVWTEFVHRLPRSSPRYRNQQQEGIDMSYAFQQYAFQQQNLTPEQRAALAQQQLGSRCYDQHMFGGFTTNPFGWPFQ